MLETASKRPFLRRFLVRKIGTNMSKIVQDKDTASIEYSRSPKGRDVVCATSILSVVKTTRAPNWVGRCVDAAQRLGGGPATAKTFKTPERNPRLKLACPSTIWQAAWLNFLRR